MLQVMETMDPPRRPRRDTSTFLRPVANELVEALELEAPTTADPGFWKTADGLVWVNAGLIKDGFTERDERLRVLISFDPKDLQNVAKERMRKEFPSYDDMDSTARRAVWARILQIGKQARAERVAQIVKDLDALGVDLPVHNLVVHRVSNTFFATVDLEILSRLAELHRDGVYTELRRINVQQVAEL